MDYSQIVKQHHAPMRAAEVLYVEVKRKRSGHETWLRVLHSLQARHGTRDRGRHQG